MTSNIIPRTCKLENCHLKRVSKGFCSIHYQRIKATGTTDKKIFPSTCSVNGCTSVGKITKGLCRKHYSRFLRHGSTNTTRIMNDDKKRIMKNCEKSDSGCWEWKKAKRNGYGQTSVLGKQEIAHRASWIIFRGEIPSGMNINHKCNNKGCVNPDHLYVGTQQENVNDMIRSNRGWWQ